MQQSGLHVVATPIGNLKDISLRALDVLQTVDLVVAEDTRHTRKLLQHHGIQAALDSVHEHNESRMVPAILARLKEGQSIALVSDAGTPLISDPGYRLVTAAAEAGFAVLAVPGACAVTAALSVSGLPTDRFLFAGFLSPRSSHRRRQLKEMGSETRTVVFYESSHRILSCLEDMRAVLGGGREMVVCRELTKQFETTLRGSIDEVLDVIHSDHNQQKGEFVVLVAGAELDQEQALVKALALARSLMEELPVSQAARLAAKVTGAKRREIYSALEATTEKGDG